MPYLMRFVVPLGLIKAVLIDLFLVVIKHDTRNKNKPVARDTSGNDITLNHTEVFFQYNNQDRHLNSSALL